MSKEGKSRSSQNALKHGLRSAELIDSQRKASQELRELRSLLQEIEEATKARDIEGLQTALERLHFC